MLNVIRTADGWFGKINESALLLFVRIAAGHVFWALRPETIDLFRDEYKLPLISPEIAAPMAAVAEHVLPLLLIAGLFSRFAALGLIGMTLVIQFLVYPDAWWAQHSLWLALLLVVLVRGPGNFSLDRWVLRRPE